MRTTTYIGRTVLCAATVAALAGCSSITESAPSTTPTTARTGAQAWNPGDATAGAPATTTATRTTTARIETTAAAAPSPLPINPAAVDVRSPEAVSAAVVATWFTWNTATDTSPQDAAKRTTALLTPKFAAATGQVRKPLNGPGAEWNNLAAKRAVISPLIGPGRVEGRKNTAVSAGFMHEVQLRPLDAAGKPVGTLPNRVVATTLVNTADGWRVDSVSQL